jgi:hypothetical protein
MMSEENISMELTKEQLDEAAGGVEKSGMKSIRTLEAFDNSTICNSAKDVVRDTKNASGTKPQAVRSIKNAEFTDNYIISRGVVEAFVDKYWDLV